MSSDGYLRAKVKIGSCKGPVTYKAEQQVFHHDDVPDYARTRKEEVIEWVRNSFFVLSFQMIMFMVLFFSSVKIQNYIWRQFLEKVKQA